MIKYPLYPPWLLCTRRYGTRVGMSWFNKDAVTNILSMSAVKATYDNDDKDEFMVHFVGRKLVFTNQTYTSVQQVT